MDQLQTKGLTRGRWSNIKVWANQEDANYAYLQEAYGEQYGVEPIWTCPDFNNGITDEGIHYVLEVAFRSDAMTPEAQIAPWFAGLINNSGYTAVAPGDTMASHTGWTELTTYSETDRPTVPFDAAASRAILASISWSISGSVTVKGIFITSDDVKSGTTGTLFSTALFGTPPSLVNGNVLTANYSLTD